MGRPRGRRGGGHPALGRNHLGLAEQLGHQPSPVARHQGDHGAVPARTTGAARPVQVGLVVTGQVGLHHQVDVVEMDAASRNVGGDQHRGRAVGDLGQVAVARPLGEVSVQAGGADAGPFQLGGEALGAQSGAGEHQRPVGSGDQVEHGGVAFPRSDDHGLVVDGAVGLVLVGDLAGGRVGEELLDQCLDLLVQRRREQQPLPLRGAGPQDPLHRLQEAELTHQVGLVDDGDADLREIQPALLDQVLHAAGGADHDVHAALQHRDLLVLRHPADHLHGELPERTGQRPHRAVDLLGELAGGGQHQRAGGTALAA